MFYSEEDRVDEFGDEIFDEFDMEDEWFDYGDKDGNLTIGTWTPLDSVLEDFDLFGNKLFEDFDL